MMYKKIMTLVLMGFMVGLPASGQEWKKCKNEMEEYLIKEFARLNTCQVECADTLKMCNSMKGLTTLLINYSESSDNSSNSSDEESKKRLEEINESNERVMAVATELCQLSKDRIEFLSQAQEGLRTVNSNRTWNEKVEIFPRNNSVVEKINDLEGQLLELKLMSWSLTRSNLMNA